MPTYTYECKKCGQKLDRFHGMNAKPRVKCEACGGACRRLLGSGSGIIFKGSGFYETDYKTKTGEKPSEAATDSPDKKASTSTKDTSSKKDSSKSTGSGSDSAKKSS